MQVQDASSPQHNATPTQIPPDATKWIGFKVSRNDLPDLKEIFALGVLELANLIHCHLYTEGYTTFVVRSGLLFGGYAFAKKILASSPSSHSTQKACETSSNSTTEAQNHRLMPLHEDLTTALSSLEKIYPINSDLNTITEKQKGGTWGQAIGDALGLFTEFSDKAESTQAMNGRPLEFARIQEFPGKRRGFPKNGWTDDTDQFLCGIRAEYQKQHLHAKENIENLFAKELLEWRSQGIRDINDFKGRADNRGCQGLGSLVSAVIHQDDFEKIPLEKAIVVWSRALNNMQDRPAANGAVMRTSWIGLAYFHNLKILVEKTSIYCKVTHADPRCVASTVALTTAIALIIRGCRNIDDVLAESLKIALIVLRLELTNVASSKLLCREETDNFEQTYEKFAKELKNHLYGDWDSLDLDQSGKIGYTFKCMGSAFYCLRLIQSMQKTQEYSTQDLFRKPLEQLIAEGGDADTNGAAAGALIGAYLGFDQIPDTWKKEIADQPVLTQAFEFIQEFSKST